MLRVTRDHRRERKVLWVVFMSPNTAYTSKWEEPLTNVSTLWIQHCYAFAGKTELNFLHCRRGSCVFFYFLAFL